jgi:hypothetical protein
MPVHPSDGIKRLNFVLSSADFGRAYLADGMPLACWPTSKRDIGEQQLVIRRISPARPIGKSRTDI